MTRNIIVSDNFVFCNALAWSSTIGSGETRKGFHIAVGAYDKAFKEAASIAAKPPSGLELDGA